MTALDELFAIRRIVVALDAASSGAAFLDAAVELARSVEAELEGLFVEDTALMRLAGLPFASELRLPTGLPQRLDAVAIEREVRLIAAGARRALETSAEREHVRCTFRIVRGRLEAEVCAAVAAADLVILDTAGPPVMRHGRLRSAADIAAAGYSVLLLPERRVTAGAVAVVYDGTPASGRALAAAARFAGPRAAGAAAPSLAVLCFGETAAAAKDAENAARAALEPTGISAKFAAAAGAESLTEALRRTADTLVVLPAALLAAAEGDRILAAAPGPVLLVR